MQFRTELKVDKASFQIDHSTKILSIGSCFANMIGNRFRASKFRIDINPFGIIFNPISQFNLFNSRVLIESNNDYYEREGTFFNFHFHSDLFDTSVIRLRDKIELLYQSFNEVVNGADVIIFTFGTAFTYRHLANDNVVANCHKAPSSLFKKEMLAEDFIVSSFKNFFQALKIRNPHVKIVLTVSPVRHIKDTIVLNSLSKAILRIACHRISQDLKDVIYFPSFELMMDDLRDYRFYKEDMIHPTEVAEEYIWRKFAESFFSTETIEVIKEWEKVRKAIEHVPFQPRSETYAKFIKQTIDQTKELEKYFNVEHEIKILQKKLFDNE